MRKKAVNEKIRKEKKKDRKIFFSFIKAHIISYLILSFCVSSSLSLLCMWAELHVFVVTCVMRSLTRPR